MSLRVVTRGDDAGSCESANTAIYEAATQGVLRNVSIMVPGPAFRHAVPLLLGLDQVDLGLHVTLNAEWDTVKWGPTLPADHVPSLVDEHSFFTPDPMSLNAQNMSVQEAIDEVRQQLFVARQAGLHISYLDTHMGVDWIGDLRPALLELCQAESLLFMPTLPYLPNRRALLDHIGHGTSGTFVWVTHPGRNAPDMYDYVREGISPGVVAEERDQERMDLLCPILLNHAREERWVPIRLSENGAH